MDGGVVYFLNFWGLIGLRGGVGRTDGRIFLVFFSLLSAPSNRESIVLDAVTPGTFRTFLQNTYILRRSLAFFFGLRPRDCIRYRSSTRNNLLAIIRSRSKTILERS